MIIKKNQNFIKKENRNLILGLIQDYDMITRPKLAKLADMSPTTITRIVSSLIEVGLIRESNQYTTGVGRKATYLEINPNSIMSIGVDIDERVVRYGVYDFLGTEIASKIAEKEYSQDPQSLVQDINQEILHLIKENSIDREKIIGIGIGLPGLVNKSNGYVTKSAQLDWENVPFSEMLNNELAFPVTIDNELNFRVFAEKLYMKDKKAHSLVVIGFGNGVGSALMIGNQIYRGVTNSAGEIGHTVVDPNGMLCTCGNFGCLQTFIAKRFLVQEASKKSQARNLYDISEAAEKGHKWAENILDRAINYAAITVNNSVCMNNPDMVILTGDLIDHFPHIRKRIMQESKGKIWPPLSETTHIGVSKLGERGVALGAGLYVQRKYINHVDLEKELI